MTHRMEPEERERLLAEEREQERPCPMCDGVGAVGDPRSPDCCPMCGGREVVLPPPLPEAER